MSAPSTAYLNNAATTLPAHKVGVVLNDNLAALLLSAYTDLAGFKALFYLDAVFAFQNGSDEGLIGAIIDGGTNSKYHATPRLGVYGAFKDGIPHTLLNDAGLNTLSDSQLPVAVNRRVGNIQLSSILTHAYYVGTSNIIAQYKNTSLAWTNWLNDGTFRAGNTSETKTFTGESFDGYLAGDSLDIRFQVVNDEGTFTSPILNIQLLLAYFPAIKYHDTVASYADAQTNGATLKDVYADRVPLFEGFARLFYIDTLPINVTFNTPTGYYISGGYWYKVEPANSSGTPTVGEYARVTDFGLASSGHWPSGDPGNPAAYTEIVFNAYGTVGYTESCAITESDFTRYLKASDGKVYTTTGLTTLIPDGYYTKGAALSRRWYQYTSGAIVAQGFCTTPD